MEWSSPHLRNDLCLTWGKTAQGPGVFLRILATVKPSKKNGNRFESESNAYIMKSKYKPYTCVLNVK